MYVTRWLSSLVLLVTLFTSTALGQDSTVAADNPVGSGALAFGWSELVKYLIAAAGTYGIYYLNVINGAIAGLSNWLKPLATMALTTALMYLGEFVNATVSNNQADWSAATFEGIAAGALTAFAVKLGLNTARAKSTGQPKSNGSSYGYTA